MKYANQFYYLIYLRFLGFRYHGWQKQAGVKTVQMMVDKSLSYFFGHKEFKTIGAGRTDALVSAEHFPIQLFIREQVEPKKLLSGLNEKLPPDIEVLSVKEVDADFEVISGSKQKTYHYFFSFGEKNHPFCASILSYRPELLDLELMKVGAKLFEGTHNFIHYCHRPNPEKSFIRTIDHSEISENNLFNANFFPSVSYYYEVKGTGFMRHQVRLMMGTLFNLGLGKITLEQLEQSLRGEGDGEINFIAPSSGLMLADVMFET